MFDVSISGKRLHIPGITSQQSKHSKDERGGHDDSALTNTTLNTKSSVQQPHTSSNINLYSNHIKDSKNSIDSNNLKDTSYCKKLDYKSFIVDLNFILWPLIWLGVQSMYQNRTHNAFVLMPASSDAHNKVSSNSCSFSVAHIFNILTLMTTPLWRRHSSGELIQQSLHVSAVCSVCLTEVILSTNRCSYLILGCLFFLELSLTHQKRMRLSMMYAMLHGVGIFTSLVCVLTSYTIVPSEFAWILDVVSISVLIILLLTHSFVYSHK